MIANSENVMIDWSYSHQIVTLQYSISGFGVTTKQPMLHAMIFLYSFSYINLASVADCICGDASLEGCIDTVVWEPTITGSISLQFWSAISGMNDV